MKRSVITLLFFLLLILQLPMHSFAAATALPQTGQTSCWDASGALISCVGTGQDGELQSGLVWPKPRFIDSGDQTISDKLTGLVWSKDGNPAGATKTWQQALDYIKTINSQNFLGHNDWRLPNINELHSLANAQQGDLTAWLNTQGFSNVQPDSYWSSDSDDFNTNRAWYIGLDSGYVYSNYKTYTLNVWPVRTEQSASLIIAKTGQTGCWNASGVSVSCNGTGQDGESQTGVAWPATRFTSNADQTVTDNLTGLIWTKDGDLMKTRDPTFDADYVATNNWESTNDGAVSWQHALDYIKKLNNESYLGYNDWRLPNRDELVSLINWQAGYPAVWLNLLGFTNVAADYYWSSSNDPFYTNTAWFVDMGSGYIDSYYKTDNHYVWPVRGMPQAISFTPAATATYGDSTITLAAVATSGLPANFTLVSGPATLTGNLLTITGTGTITVKASQAGNNNYTAAPDVTKSITVSPKALTITANNASRAYGAANPASPGFTAPALANGDSISSVTYSYAVTATATAAVGTTHSITPSAAVFSSGTTANYTINYVAGTLTIAGTAAQTISFTPAATATYGGPAITLSAAATSGLPVSFTLVSGSATLSGNSLTITGAGNIVLKATQSGNSNYSAAPDVQQTIAIAVKTLTITANNTSRAYGAANPAIPGFTAPALVSGDSISSVTYSYAATATTTAAVGTTHSITPSAAVFSSGTTANYTINYVVGTLTIAGAASQTISFTLPTSKTYGDAPITLSASATSGLPVSFTLVSGPATLTGNLLTITGAGTITVKASQGGNSNYSSAPDVQQTIATATKALTITANNASRAYGAANPASPGFTAPALANGDSISSVTYSYATTATATAAVGTTHSITPSAAVFSSGTTANYTINYVAGTLTIAAAPATSPPNITLSTLVDGSVTNNTTLNVAGSATDAIGIKQVTVNGTVVTVNVAGAFSQAVNLVAGINQITVTATNYSDLTATVIRNITLDQTAPLITLTEPADNSFTNKTFVTLSGTVSETAVVTISVQETSSSQLASMNGNAFSATVNLVSGVNTITIAATDVAGNSSQAKRTITSDTAAPTLAITDPAQDIKVTDTTYLLKGTVSDTVSQATVTVNIDGQKFTPSVTNGAFMQQLFFTTEKQYAVTVIATDQAGNSATVQRNIIYSRLPTGDLNGDGKVDVADALRALQIAIGVITPTAADFANGDVGPLVNGKPAPDGKIDISDAVVILEKAVGLVSW